MIPMSDVATSFPWQVCFHSAPPLAKLITQLHPSFAALPPLNPPSPSPTSRFSYLNVAPHSFLAARLQGISDVRQNLQFINAFNAPLSWLRVLKYMEELSPKTRQAESRRESERKGGGEGG
jgi:hypothetical protein